MYISPEMLKQLRLLKPPNRLVVDIVDADQFIELRIYENQVMEMNANQQDAVMNFLHKMRSIVESYGYRCYPMGVKGDPPRGTK